EIVTIPTPKTIADGAQTLALGELTFAIIKEHVTDIVTATDDQLLEAMRFFAYRMKTVVEPTAALGLAAVLNGSIDVADKRVGIIISGGNVSEEILRIAGSQM